MKGYRQVHLIVKDRGFVYEPVANTPEFHHEKDAIKYWEINQKRIQDINFYNDPIVIIRKEESYISVKEL